MLSVSNRHRSQPHNRAIAAGLVRCIARRKSILMREKSIQGISRRDADVETTPVHGILASLPPLDVSVGLVVQVPADRGDAISECQRHAGVVGPLPRLQTMWPAAAIAGDKWEAARIAELDSGSQSISHRQADQGSSAAVIHGSPRDHPLALGQGVPAVPRGWGLDGPRAFVPALGAMVAFAL